MSEEQQAATAAAAASWVADHPGWIMGAITLIAGLVGWKLRTESAHRRLDTLSAVTQSREESDARAHGEINAQASAQSERLHALEAWSGRAEEQIAAIRSDVGELKEGSLRHQDAVERHMERLYREQREMTKAIAALTAGRPI